MDNELTALKAHIDTIVPTLAAKADIEALRAEMHKMSADGYRWMVASMVGMFLGFGGLYFASVRAQTALAAPSTPAAPPPKVVEPAVAYAPPPVIIYMLPPIIVK